ncbi:putative GTP-binding protein YjiA [compost metagenome]
MPIDNALIGDRASRITTLSNGCICCSKANELADALLDLLDGVDGGQLEFDRLIIECTGMADPGPITQTFFSHELICERFLLDGIITLVDAAHADQQLNQFSIAQAQVGYADRILLTKTDVAPDCEALIQRLQLMNARAPVYTVTHGDIDLSLLFGIEGFTLNDRLSLTPPAPLFRRIPQPQNNIRSIVVYHDQPLELMQISEVMEGLLLEYADSLLRYKGILSIRGEPRRLLFQGVQRLYNADWDREWLPEEERRSTLVFIGVDLLEEEIRRRIGELG